MNYKKKYKGVHLQEIESEDDLKYIVKLYASKNPSIIPCDHTKAFMEFRNGLAGGGYLRLIMKDEAIRGFIAGDLATPLFTSHKTVQQLFYFCNLESMEAFRAVILAHEGLVRFAEAVKAKYVMSASSPLIINDNLTSILKTQGWTIAGHTAIWKTSLEGVPSRHPRDPQPSVED